MIQEVFIPGPLPGMNDFVRKHHQVYSKLKRDWHRIINVYLAKARLKPMPSAHVSFHWMERNAKRDPDNILAGGQKFVLDCLVESEILPNDSQLYVLSLAHSFSINPNKPGVIVTLQKEVDLLLKPKFEQCRDCLGLRVAGSAYHCES